MLSNDVYRECVKALAYGKTPKEIAQVMVEDKITGVYYKTRSDGVNLYRFAVPNKKHINKDNEKVWDKPQFKVRQDQTGILYDEAIDVENKGYTYTETDIPTGIEEEN